MAEANHSTASNIGGHMMCSRLAGDAVGSHSQVMLLLGDAVAR